MLRHGHVPDLRILALHPRHESFPRHTHYASVDNECETKREKGKRKKLKKKKGIKQRNNDSFTPNRDYPYRGPIRKRETGIS